MTSRLGRIALTLTTFATVLALTAGVATAASVLGSLSEINSSNGDMNSTAVEWSGATYNADSNVLVTVDDEQNAYEFQLTADGEIDANADVRIIDLALGRSDFEGIAWIGGEQYGFLSEGDSEVIIATIPDASSNGRTTIDTGDIERTFSVGIGNAGNLGPEGLATDGEFFYVTKEMPATLSQYTNGGDFVASVDLSDLADATGVVVLGDGTFLVISHESRIVAHYQINWSVESALLLETLDAGSFTQLEGIAVAGNNDLHLFGEDNTRKGNPGQTYSHLNGALTAPVFATSDVNCSGDVTIGDALIITRLITGSYTADAACGSGDHNGDGYVNVIDAQLIAQCQVGIKNVGCP